MATKYNAGRVIDRQWVFGGIYRETRSLYRPAGGSTLSLQFLAGTDRPRNDNLRLLKGLQLPVPGGI